MYQTLKIMVLGAAFIAGSCSVEAPEHKTAACETDSTSKKTSTTTDDAALALADAAPSAYTSPSTGSACSACHGAEGEGTGPITGPALDTYAANHTEADYQTIMENGGGIMSSYSSLPDSEVDEIWTWLQSFEETTGSSTTTSSEEEEEEEEEETSTTTTTETEEEFLEEEEATDDDDDSSTTTSKSSKKC